MDSLPPSPSICKRLIKLVLRGLHTSSSAPSRGSAPVPIKAVSTRNGVQNCNTPNGNARSEIVVDFRHTDGSKSSSQVINDRNRARKREDGLVFRMDQMEYQKGVAKKERAGDYLGLQGDQKSGGSQEKRLWETDSREVHGKVIKGNMGRTKMKGKKEGREELKSKYRREVDRSGSERKKDEAEATTLTTKQQHDDWKSKYPMGGREGQLVRVASDINDKCKEYIDRKRRGFSRNSSDS